MKPAAGVFLWVLSGFAQTAQPQPTFEAATLKIDRTSTSETGEFEHGRLILRWATLRHLIGAAYSMSVDDVRGGPKWSGATRFDVSAKADERASEVDWRLMLRALLTERFHLRVHNEDRPEQVYLLQVGPHGPKLQESTGSSTATSGCFGQMTCRNVTMASLARALRANGTASIPAWWTKPDLRAVTISPCSSSPWSPKMPTAPPSSTLFRSSLALSCRQPSAQSTCW